MRTPLRRIELGHKIQIFKPDIVNDGKYRRLKVDWTDDNLEGTAVTKYQITDKSNTSMNKLIKIRPTNSIF